MKTRLLIAAISLSLTAPLAFGQEQAEHQAHHPATATQTDTSKPSEQLPAMPRMMQRMEEMQAHMEKIHQANSPEERQRLMEEHRKMMQETMAMMRDMQSGKGMMGGKGMMKGEGMMGGEGMHGMMAKRHKGQMMHGDHQMMLKAMLETQRQMGKRLDLMQTLLEQMLEHEQED